VEKDKEDDHYFLREARNRIIGALDDIHDFGAF
jgi:hypothetical protein